MTEPGDLAAGDFEAAIGDEFALATEAGEVGVRLSSVRRSRRPRDGREPFAVLFHGPADRILEQGIRRLGHPRLGEFDIFLVPVGLDDAGCAYEAVFA